MRLTRGVLVGALVLVVLVTVLGTLLVEDIIQSGDSLPPGCSEADKSLPGCRPIGTERITQNALSLATVVLTTVGVVFVAVLTARTTDRRQERALAEERRRHQQTLEHERDLADVEELRKVIDKVSVNVAEIGDRASDLAAAFRANVRTLPKGDEAAVAEAWQGRAERERALIDEVETTAFEMVGNTTLLISRLGPEHGLVLAYAQLWNALRSWVEQIRPMITGPPEKRDPHVEREAFTEITEAVAEYGRQAYRIIKVKLVAEPARDPSESPPGSP